MQNKIIEVIKEKASQIVIYPCRIMPITMLKNGQRKED
jgi:hypothetical protein